MVDFLQLSIKSVREVERQAGKIVLNEKQCRNLLCKLVQTVNSIVNLIGNSSQDVVGFALVLKDVYRVISKAQSLVENCAREDWCYAAAVEMDNKEAFREVLIDLECCFHTMCEQFGASHPSRKDEVVALQATSTFYPATFEEVGHDQQSLDMRLQAASKEWTRLPEGSQLAKYLWKRLTLLRAAEGEELDAAPFPKCSWSPRGEGVGSSSGGNVLRREWLGLKCAAKVFPQVDNELVGEANFRHEVGILAGLSHPNIIKFICCGMYRHNGKNVHFVGMELMEKNLSDMLREGPTTYLVAIDIMLQIASGMCYLHDMKVAHRDLKPDNVLVTPMKAPVIGDDHYVFVKLCDFGISKIEVGSNSTERTYANVGTSHYMAPEAYGENSNQQIHALKADVYSFGMTCSEILSREKPFANVERHGDKFTRVKNGERPKLPSNCSELALLIADCWSWAPSQRPTFPDICSKLRTLRSKFLKGVYVEELPDFNASANCKASDSETVKMTRNPSGVAMQAERAPTYELVGLEQSVAKIEIRLQNIGALGMVGMGGIGKSTLARAVLDHVRHKFDASSFLSDLKSKSDHLQILKDVLKDLGEERRIEDVPRAQTLMKTMFEEKKVIVVLDDVGSDAQLDALVPLGIHVEKGSRLILTSRNWQALKSRVDEVGKVDVDKLNEDQAMKLFTSCAFTGKDHCPAHFDDVAHKIVESCNGLPLSLKVTGAFLHGQMRLRIWERALKRLRRARSFGGRGDDEKLWSTLRVSFDELGEEEKETFLDISCFFCRDVCPEGMPEVRAMRIWSDTGKNPKEALANLKDRSLVKVDGGVLEMHDQLRDMGRRIEESSGTRLWNSSRLDHYRKGMENVRGILIKGPIPTPIAGNAIVNMPQLRLLRFQDCADWDFIWSLVVHSCQLRDLTVLVPSRREHDFVRARYAMDLTRKFGRFMTKFRAERRRSTAMMRSSVTNIHVVDIRDCTHLKVPWNDVCKMTNLKELELRGCQKISRTLGRLTLLTVLNLSECTNVRKLPKELGNLTSLKILNLKNCWDLTELPATFGNLTSLSTLDLSCCETLNELPATFGNLTSLSTLDLSWCKTLKELPATFGNLTSLSTLDLSGCQTLKELPATFGNLTSLSTLDLNWCKTLKELPATFVNLTSLSTLSLRWCETLKELPATFGNLTSLSTLDFRGCETFNELPTTFGNLTCLRTLDLRGCETLKELPTTFGNLTCLRTFDLRGCERLKELPATFGNLTSLSTFDLRGCKTLKMS